MWNNKMNRNTEQAFFLNQNNKSGFRQCFHKNANTYIVGGRRVRRTKVSKVENIRAKEAHMAAVTLFL